MEGVRFGFFGEGLAGAWVGTARRILQGFFRIDGPGAKSVVRSQLVSNVVRGGVEQ